LKLIDWLTLKQSNENHESIANKTKQNSTKHNIKFNHL
jgi:hypothetical protein